MALAARCAVAMVRVSQSRELVTARQPRGEPVGLLCLARVAQHARAARRALSDRAWQAAQPNSSFYLLLAA